MYFNVLITNGKDIRRLIWLKHTGQDVYCGYIGADNKYTYHCSGKKHQKFKDGRCIKYQDHLPLNNFKGCHQICTFGFSTQKFNINLGNRIVQIN